MTLTRFMLIATLICLLSVGPARSESEPSLEPFAEGLELMNTLSGQPRLLQFWASWCGSCFRIMEDISRLSAGFPDLHYLAISIDDDMAEPAAVLMSRPVFAEHPERFWFDRAGLLSKELAVVTTPTLVLLDADGVERHRHLGHLNSADLQSLRRQLLALFPEQELP